MKRNEYPLPRCGAAFVLGWILLGAGACSSLPEPGMQPHADHDVVAVYEFDGERHAIRLPSSGPDLTIYELMVEPALPQRFRDQDAWVQPAPDTDAVRVRCRFRGWARSGATGHLRPPLGPRDLFPGATRIEPARDE
jgi:hypothetical protein